MVDDVRPSRAVYSTLFGGYESLNEDHVPQMDVATFCFTDDPELTSDFWEVVVVERAFPLDPIRSQRLIKIAGHPLLANYAETLYVDNAVTIKGSVHDLLDAWLKHADVALPWHSFRSSVEEEFTAVVRQSLDELPRVTEQYEHYMMSGIHLAELRPYWTAIIARRHSPDVDQAFTLWSQHVLRYSRRDQLSCRVALLDLDINGVEINNYSSAHHTWPRLDGRRPTLRQATFGVHLPTELGIATANAEKQDALNELAASRRQVNDLERQVNDLERKVRKLAAHRATLWSAVRRRIPAPLVHLLRRRP